MEKISYETLHQECMKAREICRNNHNSTKIRLEALLDLSEKLLPAIETLSADEATKVYCGYKLVENTFRYSCEMQWAKDDDGEK